MRTNEHPELVRLALLLFQLPHALWRGYQSLLGFVRDTPRGTCIGCGEGCDVERRCCSVCSSF